MKHSSQSGFTIVELVVVVVILGVLAAIGLTSYSSYLGGSRDSNRLTQISNIKSGLNLLAATRSLPLPEDNIKVLASTALIGYQGYAGPGVIKTIGYTNGGVDPYDKSYFTYYLSKNLRDFQLMAFLEEDPSDSQDISFLLTQAHADTIDYTERYPVVDGKALGVLIYTQDASLAPIQTVPSIVTLGSIDVVTTGNTFKAYYSDDEIISGTGGLLASMIPNKSCERLHQLANHKGSGVYKINPSGASEFQVYCDMETDGGGWTKVAKVNRGNVLWNAYTTDMNLSTFLSGTGGRNFAQFSLDPLGEDLEYMMKVDGVQKGPIYSGVNYQAWDNIMGASVFDLEFFYRSPSTASPNRCPQGAYHSSAFWNWSISASITGCSGYTSAGGFILHGSSELGSELYGLNTYNANTTWKNLEIYIR